MTTRPLKTAKMTGRRNTPAALQMAAPAVTRSQVAKGIKRIRLERKWGIDAVAALFGCDRSTVSRIEACKRGTPDPEAVTVLLGVTTEYLLADCPQCGYEPPAGFMCLRCGTGEEPARHQ